MKNNFRPLAIISLVFVLLGTIFLTIYFFNQSTYSLVITITSYIIGLSFYFIVYLKKGFPSQQLKEEKYKQLEDEYYDKLASLEPLNEESKESVDDKEE